MGASLLGNELCERYGRRRVVTLAMIASFIAALAMGLSPGLPFPVIVALFVIYSGLVMVDSGSLTAGAVQVAATGYRGTTLAVHALIGFSAALLAPLAVGLALDHSGGQASNTAWFVAFAVTGAGSIAGAVCLNAVARNR